jgi:tRNA dimethylallyltransferase
MRRVMCLLGPTASGKTALALNLATILPIEIINVDSAQVYQGMEIGTGVPDKKIRAQIPHHLIDFLDPATPYNAAQFREDALVIIEQIFSRGKIPLLVGGTMYYFKALQQGLAPLPQADPVVRAKFTALLHERGLSFLYEQLQQIDPLTAKRLAPTDSQRIQRALEVYAITQKPLSYWLSQQTAIQAEYVYINVALMPLNTSRAWLHQRIEKRFDEMLALGLIEEVTRLKQRPDLNLTLPAIRAVGYAQVWQYLQGELTYEAMREKAIAATRQLAKRQLTWLRHWPNCLYFDFLDPNLIEKMRDLLLKK